MRAIWMLTLTLALAAPSAAFACHNGVEVVISPLTARTRRADRLLTRGRLRRAFRLAGPVLDEVKRLPTSSRRRQQLEPRLLRILAIVTVRVDGNVRRRRWATPRTVPASVRRENLDWAARTLAEQAPADALPVARSLHGQALSAAGRHREAVAILAPLAASDLLPDAHGYAALARSHAALGQAEERAEALQTCRRLAGRTRPAICFSPGES